MKKTLSALLALGFLATTGLSFAGDDKVAAACKDKKAGETVKVDGKDVKCPEKKK
ncbi:hypothetical protein SVA_3673 [Sulfurifustis variabilis]|uniref:Uncharacterized protein n=1 Tax=Sulfurifustis variabilis TaxID=1675686 RepID=A0A1B4V9H1_9GAMM|nr:hypothetical protein [Sulfurifustis variabilis]BAU50209.1 hypothetical protein SVA_3673 [Sulfurifustis variabilis]